MTGSPSLEMTIRCEFATGAVVTLKCACFRFARSTLRELRREAAQERLDVGDEADRLEGAAVAQLGDRGRVDVDADDLDPGREKVPGGDRVEPCRDHEREPDLADGLAHPR